MTVASISTTISSVVEAELGGTSASYYAPAVTKVTEALAEREYDIVEAVVEAAADKYGVSASEVTAILTEAGLTVRPAPVFEAPELKDEEAVTADDVAKGKLSKGERIAKLEEGQAAILEAIKGLTTLANRHLGANL